MCPPAVAVNLRRMSVRNRIASSLFAAVTACQAVCPTRAIHFGDLNEPQSEVRTAKASPLDYALLAELNTRPRTTYLARVRNPDPELE